MSLVALGGVLASLVVAPSAASQPAVRTIAVAPMRFRYCDAHLLRATSRTHRVLFIQGREGGRLRLIDTFYASGSGGGYHPFDPADGSFRRDLLLDGTAALTEELAQIALDEHARPVDRYTTVLMPGPAQTMEEVARAVAAIRAFPRFVDVTIALRPRDELPLCWGCGHDD